MVRQRRIRWSFVTPLLMMLLALSLVAPSLTLARQASDSDVHGINPADMDFSVDPAEDFFRFANGGWLDRTEIPADEGAYGVFNELIDRTRVQLLDLLNEKASGGDLQEGSDEWKAAEIYRQGIDIETRNEQGIEPIQPILDRIDAIQDLDDFHEFQQSAAFSWLTGLFWIYASPDLADSSVNAAYLSSSFFGLPNRDYYLEDDEGNAEVREAYIQVLADLLGYIGYDDAEAADAAQAVYDLERQLVEPTLTREESQDASLSYNPTSVADLAKIYPLMDWDAYLAELGLTGIDTIVVTELRYLEALEGIVSATPIETLKDFVKMEVLWSFAGFLGEDIGETAFSFQGGVLSGVDQQAPLEERVLDETSGMLGEAIGRLYVEEYFPLEAKEQVTELVEALIVAFRARLEANPWMSEETKSEALAKLDALGMKIGYPDRWRSYEAVEIADSYVGSFLSAVNADTRHNLDQAGKPVDPEEWFIPPQTVNAFYDSTANEIVFPAAFLQAPFFDYQADPASNFGGIGFVIGHEITHGFDLQGSQFDAEGNLRNWWTEADQAAFDELNQRVVDQYSAIEVLPGVNIDGQITVTENVADLGGVQVAYDALLVYLEAQGETLATPSAEGSPAATPLATPVGGLDATPVGGEVALTQQQRFFVAAATVWREKIRDESLETQVRVDVHAPAEQRATVPIQNMDEFYEAFGIEPGDAMYLPPEERITIW
jgi:putative endopeptidase